MNDFLLNKLINVSADALLLIIISCYNLVAKLYIAVMS
jgi:hypothetical protein